MVRVLGNSAERIEIKDLGEFIYYHQIKDFTDQQYEKSKDLKNEINKGRVAKIEVLKAPTGSTGVQGESTSINIRDLKAALREVLPEFKGNGASGDIKEAVRDIAPLIVDMVRQEISNITVTGIASKSTVSAPFKGPEYIPDISTEGMKESLKPKEREVKADDMDATLAALRELKKNKS